MEKIAEQRVDHQIAPVYNQDSRILILGSFPSVKSREGAFFYHHPQNRFWQVLAQLLKVPVPDTVERKKKMLLENNIAVWDVIKSCVITGSSDSSIKDVVPNDLTQILHNAKIENIYCNGAMAHKLYVKYCQKDTGIVAIKLPSTSPANAAFSVAKLVTAWRAAEGEIFKESTCPTAD